MTLHTCLLGLLVSQAAWAKAHEKVLLQDVTALTFTAHKYTAGIRSRPVQQLTCIDGDACGETKYLPKVVQCINSGWDGQDVQWKCSAELNNDVRLGETTVICEGYRDREDPYVVAGSCSLEYTLHTTFKDRWNSVLHKLKNPPGSERFEGTSVVFPMMVYGVWIVFGVLLVLWMLSGRYPWLKELFVPDAVDSQSPPSYERVPKSSSGPDSRPAPPVKSFLGGLFAGGIFGYLWSLARNRNSHRDGAFGLGASRRRSPSPVRQYSTPSTHYYSSSTAGTRRREAGGGSASTSTSTGYGGTRRI
ncbi:Store-operated calcium entry-associated regulatory factor [Kappamyces sp. JEL0829]|nr:Store-operated calcium entry-associated regulatory factor [Kappamyces sp. JEL0829]